jgi:hypothetical protein
VKDLKNVIRVNTDSFSVINENIDLDIGCNIGQWKLESKYCGNIEIVNLNTVYKLDENNERIIEDEVEIEIDDDYYIDEE